MTPEEQIIAAADAKIAEEKARMAAEANNKPRRAHVNVGIIGHPHHGSTLTAALATVAMNTGRPTPLFTNVPETPQITQLPKFGGLQ